MTRQQALPPTPSEEPDPFQQHRDSVQGVVTKLNALHGCNLHVYTHACPVQIHGMIDGKRLWFRSRSATWTLYIDAYPSQLWDNSEYCYDGEAQDKSYAAASWLEGDELYNVIADCIRQFRQSESEKP